MKAVHTNTLWNNIPDEQLSDPPTIYKIETSLYNRQNKCWIKKRYNI